MIKQGAKLVTGCEGVIEELPASVRAEPVETATSESAARRGEFGSGRTPGRASRTSGLTSSELLAGLFDLELKGVVRQLPGKQFLKVLL